MENSILLIILATFLIVIGLIGYWKMKKNTTFQLRINDGCSYDDDDCDKVRYIVINDKKDCQDCRGLNCKECCAGCSVVEKYTDVKTHHHHFYHSGIHECNIVSSYHETSFLWLILTMLGCAMVALFLVRAKRN